MLDKIDSFLYSLGQKSLGRVSGVNESRPVLLTVGPKAPILSDADSVVYGTHSHRFYALFSYA